jgi:hypothetical protein
LVDENTDNVKVLLILKELTCTSKQILELFVTGVDNGISVRAHEESQTIIMMEEIKD